MPFIPLNSSTPGVELGAWKIEEDELYFLERVKLYENEWKRLSGIMHPQKRLEWLSSRLCMKELLKIANDNIHRVESMNAVTGKPYLSNDAHKISFSHSEKYSAAIASLDHDVGIDIEYLKRNRNIRTRFLFMNEAELEFYDRNEGFELFLLIWSTKETVYKMHGQGVAFKDNIFLKLENFTLNPNGTLIVDVKKDDWIKRYEISYKLHTEFVLTYTSDRLCEKA